MASEKEEYVYRISSGPEWESLQREGTTLGGDLDKTSAFIHLSNLNQVEWVLSSFYKEHQGWLFLLQIDAAKLGDGLVYEAVGEESLVFPHFYGPSRTFAPLPLQAVTQAQHLIPTPTGFTCPLLTTSYKRFLTSTTAL